MKVLDRLISKNSLFPIIIFPGFLSENDCGERFPRILHHPRYDLHLQHAHQAAEDILGGCGCWMLPDCWILDQQLLLRLAGGSSQHHHPDISYQDCAFPKVGI